MYWKSCGRAVLHQIDCYLNYFFVDNKDSTNLSSVQIQIVLTETQINIILPVYLISVSNILGRIPNFLLLFWTLVPFLEPDGLEIRCIVTNQRKIPFIITRYYILEVFFSNKVYVSRSAKESFLISAKYFWNLVLCFGVWGWVWCRLPLVGLWSGSLILLWSSKKYIQAILAENANGYQLN